MMIFCSVPYCRIFGVEYFILFQGDVFKYLISAHICGIAIPINVL